MANINIDLKDIIVWKQEKEWKVGVDPASIRHKPFNPEFDKLKEYIDQEIICVIANINIVGKLGFVRIKDSFERDKFEINEDYKEKMEMYKLGMK